jgi:hypothetical protein
MQTQQKEFIPRISAGISNSMATTGSTPLKRFGKTNVRISALGLGGHHLGAAKDEQTAVEIVHRAVDGGITFLRLLLGMQPRKIRLARQGSERSAGQAGFYGTSSLTASLSQVWKL